MCCRRRVDNAIYSIFPLLSLLYAIEFNENPFKLKATKTQLERKTMHEYIACSFNLETSSSWWWCLAWFFGYWACRLNGTTCCKCTMSIKPMKQKAMNMRVLPHHYLMQRQSVAHSMCPIHFKAIEAYSHTLFRMKLSNKMNLLN